jgi:hypothetical protein
MIRVQLLVFREAFVLRLNKWGRSCPSKFHYATRESDSNTHLSCPACRLGRVDLIGSNLQITSSFARDAARQALTTITTAGSTTSMGLTTAKEMDEFSTALSEDKCAFCGLVPLKEQDVFIQRHVMICRRRSFPCPLRDCGHKSFTWDAVYPDQPTALTEAKWWDVLNRALQHHLQVECTGSHQCSDPACVDHKKMPIKQAFAHERAHDTLRPIFKPILDQLALTWTSVSQLTQLGSETTDRAKRVLSAVTTAADKLAQLTLAQPKPVESKSVELKTNEIASGSTTGRLEKEYDRLASAVKRFERLQIDNLEGGITSADGIAKLVADVVKPPIDSLTAVARTLPL